jgi:phage terminase small subunit
MVAARTLAQKHLHVVEAYCRSLAMLRELHEQIGSDYIVSEEGKYGPIEKPNPRFALYQKTEAEFRLLAVELGRTPRTGAGIKSGEKPKQEAADPFERLLNGLPGGQKTVN